MGKPKIPAEQRAAMAAQAEQMKMLKNLPLPELQELVLKNPELVGLLEAEELGPSALEDVQTDPRLKEAQMQALQSIRDRAEQGLTSEDKLAMEQMLSQTDAAAKSRQEGLMQEMARRGTLDSGASLAASLSSQQGAATNARNQAMQMAAQSSANRAQAAQQVGNMAGQMEQADYNRGANLASAKDRIAQANAAARMQVNQQNLAARQAIENQKASLQNQQTMYNIGRDQQNFQNQLAKAGAGQSATNAYANMASQIPQGGGRGQLLGTLAGAGIGAMVAGPGGALKGAQAGAGFGGAAGGLLLPNFENGGTIHAENGNLMYPMRKQPSNLADMFNIPQRENYITANPAQIDNTPVPSNLDIFQKKLTDSELKNTFSPQRTEYVTKPQENVDIPFRKETSIPKDSMEDFKKNAIASAKEDFKKIEEDESKGKMSDEDMAAIGDIAKMATAKPAQKEALKLDTNVQFAQPQNVLAQKVQPQQFANPFAAQDGGTYYQAEDGDVMYKSDGNGDVVEGDSFAGDRVDAKLNSGEMVLNVSQQQRLMDLIRGKAKPEDLGDKDIVEGVPKHYQEKLKAKANFKEGGTVLSPEELAMYQDTEEEAMNERQPSENEMLLKQALDAGAGVFEGNEMPEDIKQKAIDDAKAQMINQEAKSPYMQEAPKEEPLNVETEYQKLLKEYNKRRQEKPDNSTMKGWAAAADILNQAAANYNPYYRPMKGSRLEDIQKEEQSAKTQDLNQITAMAQLLDKYRGTQKTKAKDVYKVGNELVRVGDKGVEKLYGSTPKEKPSEGEKVLDREFSKEYNKWQTGGKADFVQNKKIFDEAIEALKKDKVDTGFVSGIGAKLPLVRTNTKELETRVRKAINGMLRATLGAQFTESEGERIFAQTFDPSASETENIKNMRTELAKIEGRAKLLEDQGKYFRKNKTLSGYEPSEKIEVTAKSDMVLLESPDGKRARVPRNNVEKYIKKGAKIIEE